MNWYKKANTNLPDVWLDYPDEFESKGIPYTVEIVPLDSLTGIGWTVNGSRIPMEKMFREGSGKLPLILVERKKDGTLELHDGQHRYEAYRNVFPYLTDIKAAVFKAYWWYKK